MPAAWEIRLTLLIAIAAFAATHLVGTILHELAHAVAAVLVGFTPRHIRIGAGPKLFRVRLGEAIIEVRLIPGWGMVETYTPLVERRLGMFLHVAAGPASDIALLVALIAASKHLPSGEIYNAMIVPAILAQLLTTLANLWPHRATVYGQETGSDALLMWRILRHGTGIGPYRDVYGKMLSPHLASGETLPRFNRNSEIIAWHIVSDIGRQSTAEPESAQRLERLLAEDLPTCERILVLDALATAALVAPKPAGRADLDRRSEALLALDPSSPTLRGTRGAALIEIGRYEDGIAMLADAEDDSQFNNCLVAAFRALGYFRSDQDDRAALQFDRATALFKHEEWRGLDIERIVRRIGAEIGRDLASPSTWSVQAARGTFRTRT
jgi:hypothetical protein